MQRAIAVFLACDIPKTLSLASYNKGKAKWGIEEDLSVDKYE